MYKNQKIGFTAHEEECLIQKEVVVRQLSYEDLKEW